MRSEKTKAVAVAVRAKAGVSLRLFVSVSALPAENFETSAAAKKKTRPPPIQRNEAELAPELNVNAARLQTPPSASGLFERRSARHATMIKLTQKITKSVKPTSPSSARICMYSL